MSSTSLDKRMMWCDSYFSPKSQCNWKVALIPLLFNLQKFATCMQTLTKPIVEHSKQSNLVDEFQFVACALAIAVDAIQ